MPLDKLDDDLQTGIMMTEDLISALREYAESVFQCGEHSIHGLIHWQRVAESGDLICADTSSLYI